jgi:hypothetical protein
MIANVSLGTTFQDGDRVGQIKTVRLHAWQSQESSPHEVTPLAASKTRPLVGHARLPALRQGTAAERNETGGDCRHDQLDAARNCP